MTKIERVRKVINWLIYDGFAESDADLAGKLGYTKSSFSQIINEKVPLSDKFIDKLCATNENINKVWITKGTGEIFKEKGTVYIENEISIPQVNENSKTYEFTHKSIPLIPIEAIAGKGNGQFQIDKKDIIDGYVIPEFTQRGVEFIIRVSGSSMYPKYASGDLLGCKTVIDKSFFQWGKIYVLDTDQGPIVKRLFPADNDTLECRSDNKDYPPFIIKKDSIYKIAIVLGVLRME